jgi:hypothetical protein
MNGSENNVVTPSFCLDEDLSGWLATEEPYGTQGVFDRSYGRIQLHFATVTRDAENACLYHITGASRHRETVTPFKGTIRIDEVRILDVRTAAAQDEAQDVGIKATYVLKEDSSQKYSGVFRGQLTFQLHQYPDRTLIDNLVAQMGPLYRNFTYQGTFSFHGSAKTKPAGWGRGRLPVPEGVDVGKDRFRIAPKYESGGWQRNPDGSYKEDVARWWEAR